MRNAIISAATTASAGVTLYTPCFRDDDDTIASNKLMSPAGQLARRRGLSERSASASESSLRCY